MYHPERMPSPEEADPHEKETDAICAFIGERGMGPEAVEDALFMAIDRGETEAEEVKDESVYRLAAMLHEAEEHGVPLNGLTGILIERQYLAAAPGRFRELVGGLPIGDRERGTLMSVLDGNRTGDIMFRDVATGANLVRLRVSEEMSSFDREYRALWLGNVIREITGTLGDRKYELTFESA